MIKENEPQCTRVSERAAIILAGGRSKRFGSGEKAIAPLAGTPLIRHVADRVEPTIDELVINCRAEQRESIQSAFDSVTYQVRFAIDEEPDEGPLAGIVTGLEAVSQAPYSFIIACDMPFVERAVVKFLFEQAAGHDAAVPRLSNTWYQTTHAVFRTDPMARASRVILERGQDRIVHTFDALDIIPISEREIETIGSLRTFENINTKAELAAAEENFGNLPK